MAHMLPRPSGPSGDEGFATMFLTSEQLHYLWTVLGVHGPVIYGSPSGSVGALLLILRTCTLESLCRDGHG